MIPQAHITQWRQNAPWADDNDVEQDLIISRAVIELFNNPFLGERLAFRGGTALHKLILAPATRYSEDIDLVFLRNEKIGPVFDAIRDALTWIDPKPARDQGMFMQLYFSFITSAGIKRRLKVEISTRESFSAPRVMDFAYTMDSRFFSGTANVRTYSVEELLATKLRALYQRKKGRDLYDLWYAAQRRQVDFNKMYELFREYWNNDGNKLLLNRDLKKNMTEKKAEGVFEQVVPLLVPGTEYDGAAAEEWFERTILPLFPH